MQFAKKGSILVKCLSLCFFLCCALSTKQETEQIPKPTIHANLEQQAAQIGKTSTIRLTRHGADGTSTHGSGFLIRHDLMVTSIHGIAGIYGKSYSWTANLVNQPTQYTIKGVMASNPKRDIVVLKVAGKGGRVLPLGDSSAVELGDVVIAIGNARNSQGITSTGRVNRITPNFFRLKISLSPGYSGGPILNDKGEIVGISTQGHRTNRTGYAIPSNHIRSLLNDLPTQEKPLEKWKEELPIRAYAYANQGDTKKKMKDFEGAIEAYNKAIHLSPDFVDIYADRAIAKHNLGNYKGAVADYDTAIRSGLDYAAVYLNRGATKKKLGDYKGAITDYNISINLDAENVEAYFNRGNARLDIANYGTAIADYDEAIRLKPNQTILAIIYFKRADVKLALGDRKGAIKDYSETIHLKPNQTILATAYLNRGLAKSNLGSIKSAIEDYNEAIRLKPNQTILAIAYLNRGLAKSNLSDVIDAIKDYDEAIHLNSKNVPFTAYVYSKRAFAKLDINDAQGAIEDCNTALSLDPDLAEAYEIRGDAKSNVGNNKGAIEDYDTVVDLKPNYATPYYKRGRAKVEIGNVLEAKTDLQTALKLAKQENDNALKTKVEETLRLLK